MPILLYDLEACPVKRVT